MSTHATAGIATTGASSLDPATTPANPRTPVGRIAAGVAWAAARSAAVAGALVLTPVVGTGCLYLLRHRTPLAAGPTLPDALPLQQLAGGAAQPLLRLVVAWALTGLAAGLVIAALSRLSRSARAALTGTITLVLLIAAGAVSDALTVNEPVSAQLAAQPGRVAIWLAAAIVALAAFSLPSGRRPTAPEHTTGRPS